MPLAWDVLLKIKQINPLFDTTVYKKKLRYSLQFHVLLNQYEVKSPLGQVEMFLTLSAALNFMSLIQDDTHLNKDALKSDQHYQIALKTEFNREFLPIPLRPVAYLNSQWFLSSDWYLWPTQK